MLSNTQIIASAQEVLRQEARAVRQTAEQLGAGLLPVLELLLNCEGHVLTTGTGTSYAVAQRFAHLLSCARTPALCINITDVLHNGEGAITPYDVVYVISKDGRDAEINQFVRLAQQRGAKVIVHTEAPTSPLALISDAMLPIEAKGNVDPSSMVATASSLVNSAVCDSLCVLLIELRSYGQEGFDPVQPDEGIENSQ